MVKGDKDGVELLREVSPSSHIPFSFFHFFI